MANTQEAEDAFKQTDQQGIKGGIFYAAVYGPINRAWIASHLGRLDQVMKIYQESLDEINRKVCCYDDSGGSRQTG